MEACAGVCEGVCVLSAGTQHPQPTMDIDRPADGSLRWTAWVAIETVSLDAEVIH